MARFHHVLVPVDFDEISQHALDLAVEIAASSDAELTVLHVYTLPRSVYAYPVLQRPAVALEALDASFRGAAEAALDVLLARARRSCPRAQAIVRAGRAAQQILAHVAATDVDVIVMGTHGRHGLSRVVFGSVAERVARSSPVPVVTAPPPAMHAA